MRKARMVLETTRFNPEGEAVFEITCPTRGAMALAINVTSPGGSPVAVISDVEPTPEMVPVGVEKVRVALEDHQIPDDSWSVGDIELFCETVTIRRHPNHTKADLLSLCDAWKAAGQHRRPGRPLRKANP